MNVHKRLFNGSTLLYLGNISILYASSTFYKTGSSWTTDLNAAHIALKITHMTNDWADYGLLLPASMFTFLTWAVLKWEFWGSFMYFVPIYSDFFRMIACIGFMALHIGFYLFIQLGIFVPVPIVAQFALLPGSFWDYLFKLLNNDVRSNSIVYQDKKSYLSKWMGYIIDQFLLLPYTKMSDSHDRDLIISNEDIILEEGQGENSNHYISVYCQSTHMYKYNIDALVYILRYLSPLTTVFGWILSKLPVSILTKVDNLLLGIHMRNLTTHEHKKPKKKKKKSKLFKRIFDIAMHCLAVFILLTYFWYTLRATKLIATGPPEFTQSIPLMFNSRHGWSMYSPQPSGGTFYPLVVGTLKNNQTVEFVSNRSIVDRTWRPRIGKVNYSEFNPVETRYIFPTLRWRKLFESMRRRDFLQKSFAQFVCREYNSRAKLRKESPLTHIRLVTLTYSLNKTTMKHNPARPSTLYYTKC